MESPIASKNKLKNDQVFKISRFKELIKKTKPHKHEGYYELIFIEKGEGFHWIESNLFQLNAPDLFFMKPGQMHYWQFTAVPKGYVLLFKDEFIDPVTESPIWKLIHQLNQVMHINLAGKMNPVPIFDAIYAADNDPESRAEDIILGGLRTMLAVFQQKDPLNWVQPEEENALSKQFLRLLTVKCPELTQVNQFAEALHCTPQLLNQNCKKYLGKNAGEIISRQLLLEAKRYVLHTEMSMVEIASFLKFNDSSYFVKFFKKHTGNTPHQFRKIHLTE